MIGDTIVAQGGGVDVRVRVRAPTWGAVNHLVLYANSAVVADQTIPAGQGTDYETMIHLDLTKDSWVVAEVDGPTNMFPVSTPVELPPLDATVIIKALSAGLDLSSLPVTAKLKPNADPHQHALRDHQPDLGRHRRQRLERPEGRAAAGRGAAATTPRRPRSVRLAAGAVAVTRLLLATALAICLAGGAAWGHTFPPARNVVVQVEPCDVVLLVGYRPGTGEPTEAILARAASAPKPLALKALEDVLSAFAMAPLVVSVDGLPLVPTNVRAKLGFEPGGARPMVVLLVSYALAPGKALTIGTKDPRSTRISWQDRGSNRVVISDAPQQGKWFAGVASMLLPLAAPAGTSPSVTPPGAATCARYRYRSLASSSSPR